MTCGCIKDERPRRKTCRLPFYVADTRLSWRAECRYALVARRLGAAEPAALSLLVRVFYFSRPRKLASSCMGYVIAGAGRKMAWQRPDMCAQQGRIHIRPTMKERICHVKGEEILLARRASSLVARSASECGTSRCTAVTFALHLSSLPSNPPRPGSVRPGPPPRGKLTYRS